MNTLTDPEAEAYRISGNARYYLGDYEGAIADWEKAVGIHSTPLVKLLMHDKLRGHAARIRREMRIAYIVYILLSLIGVTVLGAFGLSAAFKLGWF